jgi:uracil-DNA glycosylase
MAGECMTGRLRQALEDFVARPEARGWAALPFFREGAAASVAAQIDAARAEGVEIAPPPELVFEAFLRTPFERVKVVILGQDPYPRPGDAHGLAFSFVGNGRMPPSLKAILAEMARDTGAAAPASGDLSGWARQGVLLLNASLTTALGRSGAHMKLGWERLTGEVVAKVSAERPAVVFMLWGAPACAWAERIDRERHLVLTCGHPSPLNRKRDFSGCGHFTRANAWLTERGETPVAWDALG